MGRAQVDRSFAPARDTLAIRWRGIDVVAEGIDVVEDRSWSIDTQRYNVQFTGQRSPRIRGGKIVG